MTIDPAAAESLRTFALEYNGIAFAHLVTAAIGPDPEEWAVERLAPAVRMLDGYALADVSAGRRIALLAVIDGTDATRPDGAIAHSTVAP